MAESLYAFINASFADSNSHGLNVNGPNSLISLTHTLPYGTMGVDSATGEGDVASAGSTFTLKLYHYIDPYEGDVTGFGSDILSFIIRLFSVAQSYASVGNLLAFYFNYGYSDMNGICTQSPNYGFVIQGLDQTVDPNGVEYTVTGTSYIYAQKAMETNPESYDWEIDSSGRAGGGYPSCDTAQVGSRVLCQRVKDVIKAILRENGCPTIEWWGQTEPIDFDFESSLNGKDLKYVSERLLIQPSGYKNDIYYAEELLKHLCRNDGDSIRYCPYAIHYYWENSGPKALIYPTHYYTKNADGSWTSHEYKIYGRKHYIWNNGGSHDSSGYGEQCIIDANIGYDLYKAVSFAFANEQSGVDELGNPVNGQALSVPFAYSEVTDENFALWASQVAERFDQAVDGFLAQGSITIPGTTDHFLPFEYIQISIIVANTLYPTSGYYIITSKEDTISGGKFTTKLAVQRVSKETLSYATDISTLQINGTYGCANCWR